MTVRLAMMLLVIGLFGVLSGLAIADVGYFGIIAPHFQTWGGGQVFADLVILAVLACFWMVSDSRASGISPWPFVALTLVGGSFGPLLYLAIREYRLQRRSSASA